MNNVQGGISCTPPISLNFWQLFANYPNRFGTNFQGIVMESDFLPMGWCYRLTLFELLSQKKTPLVYLKFALWPFNRNHLICHTFVYDLLGHLASALFGSGPQEKHFSTTEHRKKKRSN